MLCITSHEGMTDISIDELEHLQVSSSSWTSQQRIVLSWDLLSWISVEGGIPCSFTNFITTPELSGPLYISPDIYHTQITEYSLKTIFLRNYSRWASLSLYIEHFPSPNCYNFVRPSSFSCSVKRDWSFMEHLPRALPTENDFSSTSINSFGMPCTWLLSKIYAWYTGSYYQVAWGLCLNECNRQRQIPSDCFFFMYRDLIPSDRSSCTSVSRVKFFDTKKIPSSLTKYVWLRYECFAFFNDGQSQSQYTLILLAL